MASEEEIDEAVFTARDAGCNDILLFHCISSYPAPLEEANLKNIVFLANKYSVEVGCQIILLEILRQLHL